MRQGTGYAYGDGEDCISYKCEGCGQRVRVTPAQAQYFRGAFTACSRVCVLKARDHPHPARAYGHGRAGRVPVAHVTPDRKTRSPMAL